MQWIRNNLKIVIPAGLVLVLAAAYLAFGVFGVQFLFIDDKVDEAAPVFESGAGAAPATATESTIAGTTPPTTEPLGSATTVPPTTQPQITQPQIVTVAEGVFGGRSHPGEGVASVLSDGSAQRFLRFEEFSTDNGPDLNVYLTVADADAPEGEYDDDFVDLGNLKGNIGDQNYEIPPEVDLERYDTVVVWCVRFGVAFTTADLVAT
jgi:hypothetical protein